jgi:Rrf2 family protein
MISAKCKYGLKAMVYINSQRDKGPVVIAQIAEAEKIPKKYLDVILLELKTNGMLVSKKGKGGGYQLARSASAIRVADIMRVLGGPQLAPVPCVSKLNYRRCTDCRDEETCVVRSVMLEVRDAIAAVLENITLEEMASRALVEKQFLTFDI